MKEFRCTRRSPYSNPNCPGHTDTRCRQGYYIEAKTAYDALREMRRDFPRDPLGFDIEEVNDQEPAAEPHDDTQCHHLHVEYYSAACTGKSLGGPWGQTEVKERPEEKFGTKICVRCKKLAAKMGH